MSLAKVAVVVEFREEVGCHWRRMANLWASMSLNWQQELVIGMTYHSKMGDDSLSVSLADPELQEVVAMVMVITVVVAVMAAARAILAAVVKVFVMVEVENLKETKELPMHVQPCLH